MKNSCTRLGPLFFRLRQTIRAKMAKSGTRLDPSAWMRIEALRFIEEEKGPTMRALAGFLSVTAPSATSFTRALTRAGLITRRGDAADKRSTRLYLTPGGTRLLVKAKARQARVLSGIFSELSSADLAELVRILTSLTRSDVGYTREK